MCRLVDLSGRVSKVPLINALLEDFNTRFVHLCLPDGHDPTVASVKAQYGMLYNTLAKNVSKPVLEGERPRRAAYYKDRRYKIKETNFKHQKAQQQAVEDRWPQRVAADTIKECCRSYYKTTKHKTAPLCAVCARSRCGATIEEYKLNPAGPLPDSFRNLNPDDTFLSEHAASDFEHADPRLNGLMLDHSAIKVLEGGSLLISVCDDCH